RFVGHERAFAPHVPGMIGISVASVVPSMWKLRADAPRSSCSNRRATDTQSFTGAMGIMVVRLVGQSKVTRWEIAGASAGGIGYLRSSLGLTQASRCPSCGATVPFQRRQT